VRAGRVRGDDRARGPHPGETETIPLRIYADLDAPGGEARIGGLVAASIILCLACVLCSRLLDRWYRRRLELDHLTRAAADSLGLVPGARAYAVIKATSLVYLGAA
jgi:hypothetical protein